MEVSLYVYDLSRGLARQYSELLLGTRIDAVYHTALVFNNVEWFFGRGVQTCLPGTTHHGQPMQKIYLGTTDLPMDVILEYLESLKAIYTAESYDLFLHNCNHFSNDFAMFLVGQGIPEYITNLPATVLNTPFGQMLKPQLDQAMRGITQAEVVPPNDHTHTNSAAKPISLVHTPTSMSQLTPLLERALSSCAVLFFTSQTCPPCKICYGPFEDLANEFETEAVLVKIDISQARDIAEQYAIRATPTFITILKGEQLDTWTGADVARLQGNTRMLVQMAFPPHPHTQLRLSTLQQGYRPQLYSKMPPLDKLLAKLDLDTRSNLQFRALKEFVSDRADASKIADVQLPDLTLISQFICNQVQKQEPRKIFPLIDLFRLALLDARVSGFFAEEKITQSLLRSLIACAANLTIDANSYPFLLTTVQALSNIFTFRLSFSSILAVEELPALISNCLLASGHANLRAAASNLMFNIANAHHKELDGHRRGQHHLTLSESAMCEFVVGNNEALNQELARGADVDKDTVKGLLLSVGLLLYAAPTEYLAEVTDVLTAVEARNTIKQASDVGGVADIVKDVLQILP